MENNRTHYWKIGLIIVLFLSIFFTHNTQALTLTQSVNPTGNSWTVGSNARTILSDGTILSGNSYGIMTIPSQLNVTSVRGIYRSGNIDIVEGNYYTFLIGMRTDQGNTSFVWRNYWNESNDFTILNVEEIEKQQISDDDVCIYYQSIGNNNYQCTSSPISGASSSWYRVWLKANVSGSRQIRVGGTTMGTIIQLVGLNLMMGDIFEYTSSDPNKEAEEKTEEATQEGQDNSDSAQNDNEGATSSLLDVAGGIIGALGASPSNCSMNMDLGNVDFGNINFCSGKPSEFSAIIDTVVILMLIPLILMTSISLVHQFINLTKFAQGGD